MVILVVDDDAELREALAHMLCDAGYTVQEAGNGAEALAVMHGRRPPDLILLDGQRALPTVIVCDLRMPVMDGWALWQALRQDKVLSAIPLVLMSGNPYELNKLDDSVTALAKPIGRDALLSAITASSNRA